MGRSIVYCSICGCSFEDVLENGSYAAYDRTLSPQAQTKYLENFRVIGKSSFTHETETSETPFGVSPPARDAEFRSCSIEGRESNGSEFSCFRGKSWILLEPRSFGTVLYPLHETCIEAMQRVAQYNALRVVPSDGMGYTSLQGYYEALLRLHDRLTIWPHGDPETEEQLSKFHVYSCEYGSYALAWEHQYYGAARFATGSEWDWSPEWEWLCTDSYVIPDLTLYILSKLSPIQTQLSPRSLPAITLLSSHPSLPVLAVLETLSTEIIHLITLHAGASASLRLHRCSKTLYYKTRLTQSFWRDHLVSGSLIDYLWDLGRDACRQKDQQGQWDWKALAEKLRRPNILENALATSLEVQGVNDDCRTVFELGIRKGGEFVDAPMGLQNRCRLVRIIRDIERMDLIEASEPVIEEDGERVVKRRYNLLFQ